jgi:hypothetical protein
MTGMGMASLQFPGGGQAKTLLGAFVSFQFGHNHISLKNQFILHKEWLSALSAANP